MPAQNVTVSAEYLRLPYVTISVAGDGTVTIGEQTATAYNPLTITTEKGASITLTFAPENSNVVSSVEYCYTNSIGTTMSGAKLPISGTTSTLAVPNYLKDGTGITMTVTFDSALFGGTDEASAVALTDAAVTNLAGGWYKAESSITFDHTLYLLSDTYIIIDEGATMTVNASSGKGIDSEYTLTVSGAGALSVTAAGQYQIAIRVGSYVQTGGTVTANGYIGIRCYDNFDDTDNNKDFTFSGGKLTATGNGGDGIYADEVITLGYTNADDFIEASSYSGTVTVAEGKTFITDDASPTDISGTVSNLTTINGKKLTPKKYTVSISGTGITADKAEAIAGETVTLSYNGTGYEVVFKVNGTAITGNTFTMPTEDVTVTADIAPITYILSYDLGGGTLPDGYRVSYDVESWTFTLPKPEREGYDFGGWTLSGDANAEPSTDLTIPQGSMDNREYIAHWDIIRYTLSYDLAGGTLAAENPKTCTIESADFTLTNPVKKNYKSAG